MIHSFISSPEAVPTYPMEAFTHGKRTNIADRPRSLGSRGSPSLNHKIIR